ncbi:MAG: hypothetical protein ACTSVI_10890 [Promethearchaeota archaeon]
MGRTVPSYRQALNREITSWNNFRRGLPPKIQALFDKMMDMARHRSDASSLVTRPIISEAMFMSILTGIMEKIENLQSRVEKLEKRNEKKNKLENGQGDKKKGN